MMRVINSLMVSVAILSFIIISGHNMISDFLCKILFCTEDITYEILTFSISTAVLGYNLNILSRINLFFIIIVNFLLLNLPDYGDYIFPGRREALLSINFIFLVIHVSLFLLRKYSKS